MNRITAIVAILALVLLAAPTFSQEGAAEMKVVSNPPDAKQIRIWVEQLKSGDFKAREVASQALSKLDDVPDALKEAIKSGDLEMKRRAEAVVAVITARNEEKAFNVMVAEMQKVEIDRLVRRMIADKNAAGDKEWKFIGALAKAITKRANDLGGRNYAVPEFDITAMPLADPAKERVSFNNQRILLDNYTDHITSMRNCVVLCTGPMPTLTSLSKSIVIVDGDFKRATGLDNCLLIVRGKIGGFTGVSESIVLATGEFGTKFGVGVGEELQGATVCNFSFLQVKNDKIRFTGSDNCTLIKTVPRTTGPTTSRVLDTDKGPLQLLKFSTAKAIPDERLNWSKEVNGLAVAIAPAELNDSFLIRWKNVGKETLELQWVRFDSDIVMRDRDDLYKHVFLKNADGVVLPARELRLVRAGGLERRPRTVSIEPGKTYEETIGLPTYVPRPAENGRYQLSIELEIITGYVPTQKGARYWTGKLQSNELEIRYGK